MATQIRTRARKLGKKSKDFSIYIAFVRGVFFFFFLYIRFLIFSSLFGMKFRQICVSVKYDLYHTTGYQYYYIVSH